MKNLLFALALSSLSLMGCLTDSEKGQSVYMLNTDSFQAEYPVDITFNIGGEYDSALTIDDPKITYHTNKPIKDVLLSVLMSNGERIAIPCYYSDRGNEVTTYNDLIYGLGGDWEPISFRFDIMVYTDSH